jgi:DNA-binding NtrC family response regulator
MSLIEEIRAVEQRVLARLEELEPLVAEHRELTALAERLGIAGASGATDAGSSVSSPSAATPAPARQRRAAKRAGGAASSASRRKRPPASGSTREAQVLAAVRATPGVTVAEVATTLGVDATSLYRVVRKLSKDGAITKRGLQLHPA